MNELLTMLILFAPLILVMVLANLAEAQRQREPERGAASAPELPVKAGMALQATSQGASHAAAHAAPHAASTAPTEPASRSRSRR